MLSGSWRRSPLGPTHSLPVGRGSLAGGTVVLEALYDYSYRGADGRVVSMQEGERFTLLKKANADWWQVRRLSSKGKALYVPATYVQEVPVTVQDLARPAAPPSSARLRERRSISPRLQTQCSAATKTFFCSMEELNRIGVIPEMRVGKDPAGGGYHKTLRSEASTLPSGRLTVLDPSSHAVPRCQSSSELPQNPYKEGHKSGRSLANTARSYSQWDVANTARSHTDGQIQVYISQSSEKPPCPLLGQKPVQLLQCWEQYQDPASGRSYYVNTLTKERSWKPPRRAHQSSRTQYTLSSDLTCSSQDANNWQLNQAMQRAASSDALISASFSNADNQCRNSALARGGAYIGHSSVTLPSKADMISSNGKYPVLMESPSTDSSPDGMTPELEKAGLLNKTKIAEGGRKLRKNWNLSWVVLVGNSLMFFKDPKTHNPENWKPGNSSPESSVDLRGAILQWANDLSSKKNVFKLRTVTGNEFLLQSETVSLISEWYTTIQKVIDKLDKENPVEGVYSLRRTISMEMLDQRGAISMEMLDQSGDEEEHRTGLRTKLPHSVSNLENSERKRVKSRLKKFILRRPPLQTLQEKGLIKDQVFGCSLEVLCEREKGTVPRFVRKCTETVEKKGLETDGIYRVSGNLAVIQKLRFAVNHERAVSTDGRYLFPEHLVQVECVDLEDPQWEDIHVVTGALKLFFRELPEPLVPYGIFHDMVGTVKIPDYLEKVDQMKSLVASMPRYNRDTMRHMFYHLKRVMEHSDNNRMTTQNIGIVFGPTLMRPEKECGNIAINMVYQNQAVELILTECEQIFGSAAPGSL